jgi:ribosomal protein L17
MPRKGGVPENLKPFKTGDSRINMKGRPPSLATELKALLSEQITDKSTGKKMEKSRAILSVLITMAIKGDIRAIQEVLDRLYGKAKQEIEVTVPELKVQPMSPDEQEQINKSIQMLNESNPGISEEP